VVDELYKKLRKKNEMGGAFSMHEKGEKCNTHFSRKTCSEYNTCKNQARMVN